MDIPSRKECFSLLDEYKVPQNVRDHTDLVNRIAVFLATKLKDAGVDIDVDVVDRASLVHDLDKMQTLETGNHGEITEKILAERGYITVDTTPKKTNRLL